MSAVSDQKLACLTVSARNKFRELFSKIEELGFQIVITEAFRTPQYQRGLQSKHASGDQKIAKPAGQYTSAHVWSSAIDLNLSKDGIAYKKATPKEKWLETGVPQIAKSLGFRWGGDWKKPYDPIHFDLLTKETLQKLSNGITNDFQFKIDSSSYQLRNLTENFTSEDVFNALVCPHQ
jgi:peptidoglycan L-alanyl-D-glutamate endopeptidase CwlK